jgi:hypothetical protein
MACFAWPFGREIFAEPKDRFGVDCVPQPPTVVSCRVGGARLAPERPDPPRWVAPPVPCGARGGACEAEGRHFARRSRGA